MSSRMFQGVVLQMKDSIDRVVGVIDAEGCVVACSDLASIGEVWSSAVFALSGAEGGPVCCDGKTFRALSGHGMQLDYAAFVKGEDEMANALCAMAVVVR